MASTKKKKTKTKKDGGGGIRSGQLYDDLREGTPKRREAAARKLQSRDPTGARAILLSVLEETTKPPSRRVIGRSLHFVADVEVARMLATAPEMELEPDKLPRAVLATLYDELRTSLSRRTAGEVRERLASLGALSLSGLSPLLVISTPDDDERLREAHVALLVDLLGDDRLAEVHPSASRTMRLLNTKRGNQVLLSRWETRGLDAYVAWLRLGLPTKGFGDGGDVDVDVDVDVAELLDQLRREIALGEVIGEETTDERRALDELLAPSMQTVSHDFACRLLLTELPRLPKTKGTIAKRIVELTTGLSALVALLDNRRYEACHFYAAKALTDSGAGGARLVLERGIGMGRANLIAAIKKLDPADAYNFASKRPQEEGWYELMIEARTPMSDPRWVANAEQLGSLSDRGRQMLIAIARDPKNEGRSRAVTFLSAASRNAADRMERRHALYALGQTKHPNATPALVEALDDPNVGDAVPLICTALAECGDTRAIRILEKRIDGPHGGFVANAIESIKARVMQIHKDVLTAALHDEDPVIANLARRAKDGDVESAIVLEDALLERGRL